MELYSATINLPEQSHSKHAVISVDMYAFQKQTIILSKMNPDPDYKYHSYHKKFRKPWWWNESWLSNIKLLAEHTLHNDILSLNDSNNSVVDNLDELKELRNIFVFLEENYKYCSISKSYDAREIVKEMYLKTNNSVNPNNMKRSLMLYGCKTKRLKMI